MTGSPEAIGTLDDVVRDVRSYIFALQPKSVEEGGLRSAIEELAKDLEVNALVEVKLEIDDSALDAISESSKGDPDHPRDPLEYRSSRAG